MSGNYNQTLQSKCKNYFPLIKRQYSTLFCSQEAGTKTTALYPELRMLPFSNSHFRGPLRQQAHHFSTEISLPIDRLDLYQLITHPSFHYDISFFAQPYRTNTSKPQSDASSKDRCCSPYRSARIDLSNLRTRRGIRTEPALPTKAARDFQMPFLYKLWLPKHGVAKKQQWYLKG